ncbi:MAG: hypothetical protein KDA60_00950 [Planctomycetales bacterium]|nr:hypothetical protein [Planctomycetales bacterium]
MSIIANLTQRFRIHAQLEALSKSVAEDCQHAVWNLVADRATSMSDNEAYGYVRARALTTVHAQAQRAVQINELSQRHLPTVKELALELVVTSTLQALRQTVSQQPARRAA